MNNELEQLEKEKFEKIFRVYEYIGDQEKHFNLIETNYRLLASTWLLASLGAIGFILFKSDFKLTYQLQIICGLCIVSSIGIFLLWIIDLRTYHQLLVSSFMEGLLLEYRFDWLPKIRQNMINSLNGDVTKKVVYYYSATISLLLLIMMVAFLLWQNDILIGYKIGLVIGLSIVIIFLNIYMMKKSSIHMNELSERIEGVVSNKNLIKNEEN